MMKTDASRFAFPGTLLPVVFMLSVLLLSGCKNLSFLEPKKDKKIAEFETKIDALTTSVDEAKQKVTNLQDKLLKEKDAQIDLVGKKQQEAANYVYAAHVANARNDFASPFTLAVKDEIYAAQGFLPGPTSDAMKGAEERLSLRLSKAEADLVKLRAQYAAAEEKAKQYRAELEASKVTVAKLHEEVGAVKGKMEDDKAKIITLHGDKDKVEKENLDKERRLRKQAEDDMALRKLLVRYLTLAGIGLGLAAALAFKLYPPIALPIGAAAGGALLAAYVVTTVPWWVFYLMLAGILGLLGLAFWLKHRRVQTIADNSIGAVEQLKNAARDGDESALKAYQRLRPELVDWFGSSGHALHEEMKQRLVKLNLIGNNTKPV